MWSRTASVEDRWLFMSCQSVVVISAIFRCLWLLELNCYLLEKRVLHTRSPTFLVLGAGSIEMQRTPPTHMTRYQAKKIEEEKQGKSQDGAEKTAHVREDCNVEQPDVSKEAVEANKNRSELNENMPASFTAPFEKKTLSKKPSTSSSTAARIKRLVLEAAEAKARIKMELIDKRLAADLAELEHTGSCSSLSQKDPASECNDRLVENWLESSLKEVKTERDTHHDTVVLCPEVKQTSALNRKEAVDPQSPFIETALEARLPPSVMADDGTNGTVHALASALKDLAAASAAGVNGSNNRLLNRLCTPKELPVYSGDPFEWLQFKQAYEESSLVCNFSDKENLWRLRKSLRGPAKDAVTALLIGATSSDAVMSTLELQFGNPDIIISRILQDISKLRPMAQEYHKEIIPFSIKVRNCVTAVSAIGCEDYLKGMNIVSVILSKLPTLLISKWTDYCYPLINERTKPKLVILSDFLNEEAVKISKTAVNLSSLQSFGKQSENYRHRVSVLINNESSDSDGNDSEECRFCRMSIHLLPDCKKFRKSLRRDRWTFVKRNGLCYKCLKSKHKQDNCSAPSCDVDKCGLSHHRLLHYSVSKRYVQCNSVDITEVTEPKPPVETVTHLVNSCKVLLKTVPVYLHGPNGKVRSVALLDDGSTVTLISDALTSRLGLRGNKQSMRVCGAWDKSELVCDSEVVDLDLSNCEGTLFTIRARSVKNMNLPLQNVAAVDLCDYELNSEIRNAICDGQYKPEILIGQDNYDLLLPLQIIKGKPTKPFFTRTPLGWCMHGCIRTSLADGEMPQPTLFLNGEQTESERLLQEIQEEMRHNFALESIAISKPRQNRDDVQACEILERTAKLIDGRWYVGLPWKDTNCKLPDSYPNALSRLKGVERKMQADPAYAERYKERVDHLLSNDYASECNTSHNPAKIWYLPHFGVDNPNKQKLRLVFDAAARSKGMCLNDYLLKGPDLLINLYGIMLRFREHRTAVAGDIRDMFLRTKILEEDRDALRFLWNNSTYSMSSLIFGSNCSPFVAQFIKNKNAERFISSMPDAVTAITKQHYMDDYIDSLENEEVAINLVKDVTFIHQQGGLEIRNWTSNNQSVLNSLPSESLKTTIVRFKDGQQYDGERTLGLIWFSKDDMLGLDVSFKKLPTSIVDGQRKPTKREMLRVLMSIFDVYGLLSPITIKGKIILQETWKSGISWDSELTDEIFEKWLNWLRIMKEIKKIRLPRHYESATRSSCLSEMAVQNKMQQSKVNVPIADPPPQICLSKETTAANKRYSNLQLHVFCDASTQAMCAVAYWRWIDQNKQVQVAFISSKCRVAPVKYVSMPRLELQAAVMASRLADTIDSEHRIKVQKKYFWCDSSTVLHWIRNDARSYKAYIAHRLGEIDELTNIIDWRYIPTSMNVADIATRESCEMKTLENEWLYGPLFLNGEERLWPKEKELQQSNVCDVDLEYINTIHTTAICLPAVPEPKRFSSWLRLLRSTCVVLCFIQKCRKLTCDENSTLMGRAEILLLKYSQMKSFPDDLRNLRQSQRLDKSSKLLTLTPILDDDGILRVGGRIDAAAEICSYVKQPVILDGHCHVAHLIVRYHHVKACHGSQEMIVNELKQRYWIIKLRPTVKHISSKCMLCRIKRAQPHPPRMGDLPEGRLAHHQRPFTHTGVDLFGPLEVAIGRRREKRYGVIFTCLTVRAIHIETVSQLTTDALIMALRRMAARRGWPQHLYSDNGTNLRGADTELKKAIKELDEQELKSELINYSMATAWSFNAPASPHCGGAWERLIRSIKTALKVVLKERAPKEEVLCTLLAEVENIINSRPLSHVTVEPKSSESLTPNHFLVGSSSNLPVLGKFDSDNGNFRKRWRQAQALADMFWKRWVREILPEMRPRQKWYEEHRPLQVGDLVLIIDPNSPRNIWPKGLVQAVFPGKDSRTRMVEIKTKSGVLRRSAARVAYITSESECCASTGGGM